MESRLKFFLPFIIMGITSACSMDASITLDLGQIPSKVTNQNRKEPDFIYGEMVTTSNGYQVKAVFGEVSEKTTSVNNNQWQLEGVFYE